MFKIVILDFSRIDNINKYSHLVQNYYCAPCVLWVDVAETELPNKSEFHANEGTCLAFRIALAVLSHHSDESCNPHFYLTWPRSKT